MTEHVLKIHPQPLADLLSGAKTAEVRDCSDRDFQVGDTVLLQETAHLGGHGFSGRTMRRTITHVQKGYGLPEWICVLSYAPVGDEPTHWANADGGTITAQHRAHNGSLGGAPERAIRGYTIPLYRRPA